MALSDVSKQMVWLKRALLELGPQYTLNGPQYTLNSLQYTIDGLQYTFELYGDNNGSLSLAQNPISHDRSKHIDIRYHFDCGKVEEMVFEFKYVATADHVADLFTKSLEQVKQVFFSRSLNCLS